jgi:hypothetical protein
LAQVKLDVEPRTLSGIPGELLLLELTIESERADSAVLRVPYSSNLVVRAVEKNLVTKSRTGGFVQKRELLLQGVEAGKTVMTNLVVEINGNLHLFPSVTVEVREVAPAAPPERVVKEAP